jgi:polysaccharide export outer membrane protein
MRLADALAHPGGSDDVILQPGDTLTVPEYNPTVKVQGAVNAPTSVLYQPGQGLGYYIANAGGYAQNANKGAVSVRYANGSAKLKSHFLFFHSSPMPGPGSTVTVPVAPQGPPFDVTQFAGSLAQILASSLAIVLLATKL